MAVPNGAAADGAAAKPKGAAAKGAAAKWAVAKGAATKGEAISGACPNAGAAIIRELITAEATEAPMIPAWATATVKAMKKARTCTNKVINIKMK